MTDAPTSAADDRVGTVAELWRYPVKSMQGRQLPSVGVGPTGIADDRAFALLDRSTGKVLSAKRHGALLLAAAEHRDGGVAGPVVLRADQPTVRCAMPLRAQPGLVRQAALYAALEAEHANHLGIYLSVAVPGTLTVGDPVVVSRLG